MGGLGRTSNQWLSSRDPRGRDGMLDHRFGRKALALMIGGTTHSNRGGIGEATPANGKAD